MRTALDKPVNALDEDERSFVAEIQEHGWFRTEVLGDRECPGFSFSAGFWIAAGLFLWEDGFDPAFEGLQPDLTEKGWLASLAA